MFVLKIGGSLSMSPALAEWLAAISRFNSEPIVIVPGGGGFADQVRKAQSVWQFSDAVAHDMALLAMQQMALMMHAIEKDIPVVSDIKQITEQIDKQPVLIWSPDYRQLQHTDLQPNWNVTSDSISAWLAQKLRAKALLLVKSAKLPSQNSIEWLQANETVDAAFHRYCEDAGFEIKFFHRDQVDKFNKWMIENKNAVTEK